MSDFSFHECYRLIVVQGRIVLGKNLLGQRYTPEVKLLHTEFIFIAVLAFLYFYLNWRETSGFLWTCVYLLAIIPFEYLAPDYFVYAIIVTAATTGIVFECVKHFKRDPFSEISFHAFARRVLNGIKLVLRILDITPRTSTIDCQKADDAQQAIDFIRNQRWIELESYLQNMDVNDRHRVIESMVTVNERPNALDQWLEAHPQSALAHISSGLHYIDWAWDARGGGFSSTVSDSDYELFYSRLFAAKQHLEHSIELDDQFAEPYVGLMTIAMGSGIDRSEISRYYAKCLIRCEHFYDAHSAMISAVAEKWGGDEGEMHVVAAKVAARAKKGSALAGIVAEAHIEQWLYLLMCDEDEEAESYFKQKNVQDDLIYEYEKLADTEPDSFAHVQALNHFAVCFYLANLYGLAKEVIEKLNGRFIQYPWAYLETPLLAYVDPAYAIDHVLKRLGISTTDLPTTDSLNSLDRANHPQRDEPSSNDGAISIEYNQRVLMTPILIALSVIVMILTVVGYAAYQTSVNGSGMWEGFKEYALPIFMLCGIGEIGLVLTNRKYLRGFLARVPAIHNQESMDALKVIARTNMFCSLMMIFFIVLGVLSWFMVIKDGTILIRILVLFMLLFTWYLFSVCNGYEERIKKIECLNENYEVEMKSVLHCWFHRALPNF